MSDSETLIVRTNLGRYALVSCGKQVVDFRGRRLFYATVKALRADLAAGVYPGIVDARLAEGARR